MMVAVPCKKCGGPTGIERHEDHVLVKKPTLICKDCMVVRYPEDVKSRSRASRRRSRNKEQFIKDQSKQVEYVRTTKYYHEYRIKDHILAYWYHEEQPFRCDCIHGVHRAAKRPDCWHFHALVERLKEEQSFIWECSQ